MVDSEELIVKFDPETRIVHLTSRSHIRLTKLAEGEMLGEVIMAAVKRFLGDGRGYLLTDYSNIIIEPKEVEAYSRWMIELMDKYLYPGGVARYGFEISRINAQLAYKGYIGGDPNLFDTREAAVAYLKGLIVRNQAGQPKASCPSPPETA
ncbi:MAG: hypothetical protein PHR28_02700 [candidate division Zixibacteria bacterium]|nr:hypothetical protein [candidate division Zixibacteria bacterium]